MHRFISIFILVSFAESMPNRLMLNNDIDNFSKNHKMHNFRSLLMHNLRYVQEILNSVNRFPKDKSESEFEGGVEYKRGSQTY